MSDDIRAVPAELRAEVAAEARRPPTPTEVGNRLRNIEFQQWRHGNGLEGVYRYFLDVRGALTEQNQRLESIERQLASIVTHLATGRTPDRAEGR